MPFKLVKLNNHNYLVPDPLPHSKNKLSVLNLKPKTKPKLTLLESIAASAAGTTAYNAAINSGINTTVANAAGTAASTAYIAAINAGYSANVANAAASAAGSAYTTAIKAGSNTTVAASTAVSAGAAVSAVASTAYTAIIKAGYSTDAANTAAVTVAATATTAYTNAISTGSSPTVAATTAVSAGTVAGTAYIAAINTGYNINIANDTTAASGSAYIAAINAGSSPAVAGDASLISGSAYTDTINYGLDHDIAILASTLAGSTYTTAIANNYETYIARRASNAAISAVITLYTIIKNINKKLLINYLPPDIDVDRFLYLINISNIVTNAAITASSIYISSNSYSVANDTAVRFFYDAIYYYCYTEYNESIATIIPYVILYNKTSGGDSSTNSIREEPIRWANWPFYIDYDEATSTYPTLEKFQKESGIKVSYKEDYNDNNEFYGKIQAQLKAKKYCGYDIITPTGWMVDKLNSLGYIEQLDSSDVDVAWPNKVNLLDVFKKDPRIKYACPYQYIMIGFGYNKKVNPKGIQDLAQLFSPQNKGKIGISSDMYETIGIIMLAQGVDITKFTDNDFKKATDFLSQKIKDGWIKTIGDTLEPFISGELTAIIGRSSDFFLLKSNTETNGQFDFSIPTTGGIISCDYIVILKTRTTDIQPICKLFNHFYDPAIAAELSAYVQYVCVVKGAQAEMEKIDPSLASEQLIFPSEADSQKLFILRPITSDEETKFLSMYDGLKNLI